MFGGGLLGLIVARVGGCGSGVRGAARAAPLSRSLDGGLAGEEDQHLVVWLGARRGDRDPGLELGEAGGELEKGAPDGLEGRVAPEVFLGG